MYEADRDKTTIMIERANNQYNIILFGLKNAGETYQRMMSKIFMEEICDKFEVYMDVMIFKYNSEKLYDKTLASVFKRFNSII